MKLNTLILIMAVLSLVWGAGFLLVPAYFWSLYGLELDAGGVYIARMLGVIFFTLGLVLWLVRKELSPAAQRLVGAGLFIGNSLGFAVVLLGQFSADISAMGWVGAVSYLFLAVGFGWYALRPARKLPAAQPRP
jgi:hypothetical protein